MSDPLSFIQTPFVHRFVRARSGVMQMEGPPAGRPARGDRLRAQRRSGCCNLFDAPTALRFVRACAGGSGA